jgi:hypothetical protein
VQKLECAVSGNSSLVFDLVFTPVKPFMPCIFSVKIKIFTLAKNRIFEAHIRKCEGNTVLDDSCGENAMT